MTMNAELMAIVDKIMTYHDCRNAICDLLADNKIDVETAELILKTMREKVGDPLSEKFNKC